MYRTGLLGAALALQWLGAAASLRSLAADVPMQPLPARAQILPARECASLRQLDLADLAEAPTSVQDAGIEPGAAGRAEFCRVKGYVAPDIQFELRLPTRTWTGRYLQGGCGGNCGVILSQVSPACDNEPAYAGSFAVGFENAGHTGGDGVWARGNDAAREDFAQRAAHVFSVAAKAIIGAYYGTAPQFSYFQGCSDGGREAMMESQRYPQDFNGLIAGSPAFAITEAMERFIWEAHWDLDAGGRLILDSAAVRLLHDAVLKACDRLDGVVDGQIDDPRRCHFDPRTLRCPGRSGTSACLSEPQVTAARLLYQGPVDESGQPLFYGGAPYGSELAWTERFALAHAGVPMLRDAVRDMIFQGELDPQTTVHTWKFDHATFEMLRRRGALFDANSPDLGAFGRAGGKLILWQGFADPAAGPVGLPDYYARVAGAAGGYEAARQFVRLFLVPGVYHCRGGYIPYEEDLLGALVRWVEQAAAPDVLIAAARLDDGRRRSRPVFAYPETARYRGGDINDAASFVGTTSRKPPNDLYRWAGADR